MDSIVHIDYLAVGHVCYDITPDGLKMGGTAAYSGRTAQVLGCQTAVLTSSAREDMWQAELPDIEIERIIAPQTTTFENVYTPDGRIQTIHAVANRLGADHVPPGWQRASIVHLGPIADEIDPDIVQLFSNSIVGLTPQGWMRHWSADGRVYARRWDAAKRILPLAAAVIISEEDLLDEQMLLQFRQWSRLLIMTEGANGCTVFFNDETRQIPSSAVTALELTGAGDIFTAAFLVRLFQTGGNPWEAARFANEIAAQSTQAVGVEAKMQTIQNYLHQHE